MDERLPNGLRNKTAVFSWPGTSPDIQVPDPKLVNKIIESLHRIHFTLGPGFFHQIYRRATMTELRHAEIGYLYIKQMPVYYHDVHLGHQDTRSILVEDRILLVTVAVDYVDEAMKSLLRSELHQQNVALGILANFNNTKLGISLVR